MKTAIVYATRSGATADAAQRLAELIGECELFDISSKKAAAKCDVSGFEAVIVGSPVRMGQLEPSVIEFVDRNKAALAQKKLGFFILNFFTEHTEEYLQNLLPQSLKAHKASFGAKIDLARLKGMDKMMMKMVAKQNGGELPEAGLDEKAIREFAGEFSGKKLNTNW